MTDTNIINEVKTFIESVISINGRMKPAWLAHEILENHKDIRGSDKDFYVQCGYGHIRHCIIKALKDYESRPESVDNQLVLEGFDYVRKAYLVGNGADAELAATPACTKDELVLKVQEYRKMAIGCTNHANELERYIAKRFN